MSIADRLGTGSSFSQAPRGRSARGRAKAITQGDVPAYELVRLRLEDVSPTPLNPRRNFGTDEEKTRFGEELRQAQLAACVAVTRSAYLALWPEHSDRIASASHVLINGERRFHSAVHVGLEALDFVVRDDLAKTREEFINYLLQENLEREDFDVIERARGVEQLVAACAEQSERGARSRAAERLGKARSWVTNQLALLELPGEIQAMLSAGSVPERDGRTMVRYLRENEGADAAALLDRLEAEKKAAAKVKAEERAQLHALRQGDEENLFSADNKQRRPEVSPGGDAGRPDAGSTTSGLFSADNNPVPSGGAQEPVPEVREAASLFSAENKADAPAYSEAVVPQQPSAPGSPLSTAGATTAGGDEKGGQKQPRRLPYDDAPYVMHHLFRKMLPEDFAKGLRVGLQLLRENQAGEYEALIKELTERELST
ncbi:ParB/RepB/Spo0J family partition protein [Streptomyces sp. MBT28]|uniref:ParB/RepB/Spo0J family partition protein n=1 Tax=Streptomyces sp. MBT28 TaxID=1488357 RepID=UPI0006191FCA|nr:plasmid partitioning protein [Streptomyces sp. MBT28]